MILPSGDKLLILRPECKTHFIINLLLTPKFSKNALKF